jgi:lipid-A-disaccharide synthase
MHLFVSAGEPSGDLHGANLIRALRARHPGIRVAGFGGDRMAAAGADLLYPLTRLAVMWVGRVLANLPTFFRLADAAERYFRRHRPDAVVLIDYPGFHWHIAKRAKAAGIPVYYFVPPQLWAWAGWRVRKMRRTVDAVLTALPFEEAWYRRRGVNTRYVGHPYFDELAEQRPDPRFLLEQRGAGRPVVGLLPGSRNQEVQLNLPMMLAAAAKVAAARPDVRFLVAAFNDRQADAARRALAGTGLDAEVHVGRTPEVIELATACIAVSGSVGLEMLARKTPAVVVYRISGFARWVAGWFQKCRYISLVNLLADEELYPEFLTSRDESAAVAGHVLRWLDDPAARGELVAKLSALRDRAAVPGACDRAAAVLLGEVAGRRAA